MNFKNIILGLLLTISHQETFSQNFFKDYLIHLKRFQLSLPTTKYKNPNSPIQTKERLEKVLNEVTKEMKTSMLCTDTIYMVSYYEQETSFTSMLIWNRTMSCYYNYTFELRNWKVTNDKLEINTNAKKILDALRPDFKKWVETIDTSSYNNYGKINPIYDGSAVRFTVAIKLNDHWHFLSSKSYQTRVE